MGDGVVPQASILGLLPKRRQRAFWARVKASCRLKVPDLTRPQWLNQTLFVIVVLTSTIVATYGGLHLADTANAMVGSFFLTGACSLVVLSMVAYVLTLPLATLPADHWPALDELADVVLGSNLETVKKLASKETTLTANDAWAILKHLIEDRTGAAPDELLGDTEFVRDLEL